MLDENPEYKIHDEEIEFKLKELSDLIATFLPAGWGHTILLHSLEKESKLFFMSNIRKEDMLATLDAFLAMQKADDRKQPPALPPGTIE